MMKSLFLLIGLISITACSSARDRVNKGASDISYGAGAVENAANSVDRAIATEKRIRERFDRK